MKNIQNELQVNRGRPTVHIKIFATVIFF